MTHATDDELLARALVGGAVSYDDALAMLKRHRAEVAALEKWRDDALETFYNICVKALGWTDPRTHHSDIPPPEWTQGKISDGVKAEMDKLRAEVERLTRENHNLSAGQKHALESCWAAESALAAAQKRGEELLQEIVDCGKWTGNLSKPDDFMLDHSAFKRLRNKARAALAGKDARVTQHHRPEKSTE